MANAANARLFYLIETTPGVIPSAAMTEVRASKWDLDTTLEFRETEEVRSDSQVTDQVQTIRAGKSSVSMEMSADAPDDFFAMAMRSTWATLVNITGTDISFAAADQSMNATTTVFNNKGLVSGQWIYITGAAAANNNGPHRINTIAAGKITFNGGAAITVATAGASINVKGTPLQNGVAPRSCVLEESLTDLSRFKSVTMQYPDTFGMTLGTGDILKLDINFVGRGSAAGYVSSSVGTGAAVAAPSNSVMNATTNVLGVFENLTALAEVTAFSFTVNNGAQLEHVVGNEAPVRVRMGKFRPEGMIEFYLQDSTLANKFFTNTVTSFALILHDSISGKGMAIDFPRMKYTAAPAPIDGTESAITVKATFKAYRDPSIGKTMTVSRW